MNLIQELMEKRAYLQGAMEQLAYDERERKKSAQQEYKSQKKDVSENYSDLRKGVGVAAGGGHLLARGMEAAKGGRKLGVGAITKALATGGASHAGATALTSPYKRREINTLKENRDQQQ